MGNFFSQPGPGQYSVVGQPGQYSVVSQPGQGSFVSSGSSSFSDGTPGNSGSYMYTNVNGQINEQANTGPGGGYLSHYTAPFGGSSAATAIPVGIIMMCLLVYIIALTMRRRNKVVQLV